MKKCMSGLFILLLWTSALVAQQQAAFIPDKLNGKWECFEAKDTGGALDIVDQHTVILSFKGQQKRITDIHLDKTKNPIWFDFSIEDENGKTAFKSLIGYVNDDMIKWQIFADEPRPEHFVSDRGEVLFLKRKKNADNITLK